jgi:hypothetical protein
LTKVPYAFSAVCLNTAGTEYFAQIDPVETLCNVFLEVDMLKILRSRSTASNLGTSMDEFIRHHPQFRSMVIKDVVRTLQRVTAVVAELHAGPPSREMFIGCELVTVDVPSSEKRTEPVLSQILETLSSFIEGVMQTPSHAREFIDLDGVNALSEIFYAPGISFDFTVYNESLSISHTLRVLSDVDGDLVISTVLRQWVKRAPEMDELLNDVKPESYFVSALMKGDDALFAGANKYFQMLTSTLAVIGLLRDLYVTHSYTISRVGGSLLKGFTTNEGDAAIVLLAILLKVSSWEFGQLMQSLDEATAAAVLLKAKTDFKAPVFSTFSAAIAQLSAGRKLKDLSDEELKERSSMVSSVLVKNILHISFTLQRLMTNIAAIFSGLAKLLSSRNVLTQEQELFDKLCNNVANSGINVVGWLTVEGKMASLGLRSFLVTHVMQFLPVIFFDDIGTRSSVMEPVVKAFVNLGGVKDLTMAIQEFMTAGLQAESLCEDFIIAVKETVGLFAKAAMPAVKIHDFDDSSFNTLREMICLYCMEFLELPLSFRKALGAEVLTQLLSCVASLVHISRDDNNVYGLTVDNGIMMQFGNRVLENFNVMAEQFINCAPDTAVEVAHLMRELVSEVYRDEDFEHELNVQHNQELFDRIKTIYGWVLSASCPLTVDVRLRLLAGSINGKPRKYLYPMLIEALPSFIAALEHGFEQKDKRALASGLLLVAEIVYLSTIPIKKPPTQYEESGEPYHIPLDLDVVKNLTMMAMRAMMLDGDLDLDLELSALYLLTALTRIYHSHSFLDVEMIIPVLLSKEQLCLESKDRRYRSFTTLVSLIVRHLIETPVYMASGLMEVEVLALSPTTFSSRSKMSSFMSSSGMEHAVCRDFDTFRVVAAKHYGLVFEDPNWEDAEGLKVSPKRMFKIAEDVPAPPSLETLADMSLSPNAASIVHCLMEHLLLNDIFPPVESAEANENAEEDWLIVNSHFKRCAILTMLVELIHSYPVCREAFVTAPRLSEFMAFIFDKMTPSGELAGTLGSRIFVNASMWVSQLLDELCFGPHQIPIQDKLATLPERVKLVVDALALSIKRFTSDCGAAINDYAKMSRTWCLTMTVYVLISLKNSANSRMLSPVQAAITARMMEKGFVSLLSTLLKIIDSKAPMAPMVSTKIVFCLEILARLGNKLAKVATGGEAGVLMMDESMSEFDEDQMEMDIIGGEGSSMEDDTEGSDSDMDIDTIDEMEMEGETDEEDMEMSSYTDEDGEFGTDDEDDDEDDDDDDDEDDDMMYSDVDDDDDGNDDHYRVIVRPPVSRSGPAQDATASGFQVIPMTSFGQGEGIRAAFRNGDPFAAEFMQGLQGSHTHFDEDDEDMISEESMGEDEGEDEDEDDEGFSVEDEGVEDSTAMFEGGLMMSMRPRMSSFGRRSVPARILGEFPEFRQHTYSSFAREADVYMHPLIGGPAPPPSSIRTYRFDTHRLPDGGTVKRVEPKIWHENQEVFHSPEVIGTIKRWTQEDKLFIGEDAHLVAEDAAPMIVKDLTADAIARRDIEKDLRKATEEATVTAGTAMPLPPSETASQSPSNATEASMLNNEPAEASEPIIYEDMGPDQEFLEALPFEMRREVLEQYFEERRRNIPEGAEVRINADFLASLSGDLREDYQRQSQREIDRYRHRSRGTTLGDLDINAILNRLGVEGGLDVTVEVETDRSSRRRPGPEQVSQLINALSDSMRRIREASNSGSSAAAGATPVLQNANSGNNNQGASVSIAKRDYANMVDVASLATILRIYYDPLMTEPRTHMKLFQHLCAGQSTRADLLNMLIYILEEMPDDSAQLDAVLESYVAISTATGGTSGKSRSNTPKTTPRKKSPMPKTSDPFGGSTYVVIQQRTLQVLMQLVQHNEDVRRFFTATCESPWTIKRVDRKAAGNKATVMTTKYPIVLLLACLERPGFVQIPLLVEHLLHLMQMVTGSLKDGSDKSLLPEIPGSFITSLVKAIIQSELSPKAFQYSTQAFQNLSQIESVANVILMELSDFSAKLAGSTTVEARKLADTLTIRDKNIINQALKDISQPTSSQSRLLRTMKMLSSTILRPLKADEERTQVFDARIETLGVNWEGITQSAGRPCWNEMFDAVGACLAAIGDESDLYHVATGLLPAIESHFWHVRQAAVLLKESRVREEEAVFSFSEKHRVILNTMIRASPSLLTTGAFILLTKMPRVLDFDNKRSWFKQQIVKKGQPRPSLSIHVRRAHIFEDSFHAIMGRSGDEVKYGRLSIKFHEEEGLDAGGVTREWFAVLSRQMFDPNYALFKVSAVDKITYQPNRTSYVNPDHLLYFCFVGRIIGKAIYDGRLLDCYFTRSFYKHILGIPVDFKDLEAVDPEFYKSLVWILENDITDVMELTFSVESDEFGIHKVIDLKPEGQTLPVTESNKREYVKLVTEYKLTTAIKPQIDAFLRGFHEIIPAALISIFNEQELELLISGMPDIDVDDWKNNTEYSGYTVSSPQIQWYWRAVRSFDQEYRAKLLQFVTGTSKVPLDGFSKLQGSSGVQRFQIHRDYGAKGRLPSAHTCFNQLDLPEYDSYEQLREQLMKAVNECSTGFGLI